MNKMKHFMMLSLALLIGGSALTSCLSNDDNDTSIDPATQHQYMSNIAGQYSGAIKFHKTYDNYSSKFYAYDSIRGSWYAGADSSFTVYNIPVSKLDSAINIKESSLPNDLKDLFNSLSTSTETVDMKGLYWIPSTGFVTSNAANFFLGFNALKVNATIAGKQRNVYFIFYGGSQNSMGQWTNNTGGSMVRFQTLLYQICLPEGDAAPSMNNTIENLYHNNVYMKNIYITAGL